MRISLYISLVLLLVASGLAAGAPVSAQQYVIEGGRRFAPPFPPPRLAVPPMASFRNTAPPLSGFRTTVPPYYVRNTAPFPVCTGCYYFWW